MAQRRRETCLSCIVTFTYDRWYLCKCNVVSSQFVGACIWRLVEYDECSSKNELLVPKSSSRVQTSRREKALGTRLSASAFHCA